MRILLLFIILLISFISCNDDEPQPLSFEDHLVGRWKTVKTVYEERDYFHCRDIQIDRLPEWYSSFDVEILRTNSENEFTLYIKDNFCFDEIREEQMVLQDTSSFTTYLNRDKRERYEIITHNFDSTTKTLVIKMTDMYGRSFAQQQGLLVGATYYLVELN